MLINLTFNGLVELDEFIAHQVKNKALQTTAAPAKPAEVKKEVVKEEPKKPEPKKPAAPKAAEPEEEAEEGEIDYNTQVAPLVLEVAEKKGRPAAVKLLADFKVTKAPQLTADQYAAFIKAANVILTEDE